MSTDPVQAWNTILSVQGWTAACDDAVISCQPSPCYGELGNGDKKKSSAAVSFFFPFSDFLCGQNLFLTIYAIHVMNTESYEKLWPAKLEFF